MGTPDFAVGTLKELIDNQYDVVAVVTQPDKPKEEARSLYFHLLRKKLLRIIYRFFSQKEQEMKHLLKN